MNDTKALYQCIADLDRCFSSFVDLNPEAMYEDYWALSPQCTTASGMASSIYLKYFSYPILCFQTENHSVCQTIFGCIDGCVGGIWFDHIYQVDKYREPDIKFNNWNPKLYDWWWKSKKEINSVMCYGLHLTHYYDVHNRILDYKDSKKIILNLENLFTKKELNSENFTKR